RGPSWIILYPWIERAVLVGCAVVITKGDQRPDLEAQVVQRLSLMIRSKLVLHYGTILAVDHEDGFLDFHAFNFIGEDGERIEAKPFEVTKTQRVNDSWITVRRNVNRMRTEKERFLQLR